MSKPTPEAVGAFRYDWRRLHDELRKTISSLHDDKHIAALAAAGCALDALQSIDEALVLQAIRGGDHE